MTTRHNDMRRIADALTNLENSSTAYTSTPGKAAVTLIRRTITFSTAALNANASNLVAPNASASQVSMLANGRVLGAKFLPTANVVAAGGNNANIGVAKLDANGATVATALASANTNTSANGGTGNITMGVGASLTVANGNHGADARFTRGTVLAPLFAQNASGVALPVGTLQVDIELEGPADGYPI